LGAPNASYFVFEYDIQSCSFKKSDSQYPLADDVAGIECWASDLCGLFRGELGPTTVVFDKSRTWTLAPKALPIDPFNLFWFYFHPLNKPDRFLSLYRRCLAKEPETVERVQWSGRDNARLCSDAEVAAKSGVAAKSNDQ
jgi:hypothetical protein